MKITCPSCLRISVIEQGSITETIDCAHCGKTIRNSPPDLGTKTFIPDENEFVPELLASLGQYEILDEIARGGMGIVYKARQKGLNRIVALKMVLSGPLASREQVARFQAEAEAAASLDHPGIVPIYEVGQAGDQLFLAMGFLDHGTLGKRLQGPPLTYPEMASLIQKISIAVQFAHERGVIHRDLKPNNILMNGAGDPVITDFGLAKNLNLNSDMTITGQIVGTPAFMSPEQARGEAAGPHVDIYSIGATMYAMLTGRPPVHAATPHETLQQLQSRDPIRIQILTPDVPKALQTICEKCLQKNPEKRYLSAQEIADDLGRWLRGEPIHARPVGRFEKIWLWMRRHPALALASSTVLVSGALISLLVSILHSNRAEVDQFETKAAWHQYLRQVQLTDRLLLLARSPDYPQAIERSNLLLEEKRTTPLMNYDLACVYALAIEQVELDKKLSASEKELKTEEYFAQAMTSLDLAQAGGYFQSVDQVESFLRDADLNSIREFSEFQEFMEAVQGSQF